jgi:RND family efflux transporter MFP subunit
LIVAGLGVAVVAALLIFGWRWLSPSDPVDATVLTHAVARRTIQDSVVEQGTLESQNTVYGTCELPGWQNKIIFIVPEGARVKSGDVVVRFDSSETQKEVDQQKVKVAEADGEVEQAQQELQVQANKNESEIAAAELALTLAEMDVRKYREGELTMNKADYESAIAEGQAELEKASDDLENIRALIKRGFRSPEQLRELELRKDSAAYRVERDRRKLDLLMNFESPRKIAELEAQAKEAARKLERARTTAQAEAKKAELKLSNAKTQLELQRQQLTQLEDVLKKCELKAPQEGTVVYANMPWFDDNERIREGATVRREQNIFYIPDMSKMRVMVNVHESVINKVKDKQVAIVRVDAYPDKVFEGIVDSVSPLASSAFFSESKVYQVRVLISQIPEAVRLKPGMSAEVEVLVGTYDDVVAVPINAVTEHFQLSYAYVRNGAKFDRRTVEVGRATQSFVEIKSGLQPNDVVALDAHQRGIADFGEEERTMRRPPPKLMANQAGPGAAGSHEGNPTADPPASTEVPPANADDDLFVAEPADAKTTEGATEGTSSEAPAATATPPPAGEPPPASTGNDAAPATAGSGTTK